MSIKKKITILFSISLLLMLSLGIWLKIKNEQKNNQIVISKYLISSKEILPLIFSFEEKKLLAKLKELNLKKIEKSSGKKIFSKSLGVGEIAILKNSKGLILKIAYLNEEHYFYDKTQEIFKQEELITTLFFIFDILLLIFIYISILKIISPLKGLSNSMQKFAKGDFEIFVDEKGSDEIASLAKSFNKMAKDLKQSFEDRENLLRYFGHEIRTPLAKAKYALEAKNFDSIKENLNKIEKFVDEILNLHLITSKNLKKSRFLAHTLIVEALNRAQINNEEDIKVDLKEDFEIEGDLHYLSIAIKNLIENAINYSTCFPIEIEIIENRISIINYGEELKEGLEFYLKPFNKKSNKGFGLGLSLSDLILKEHGLKLSYKFREGKNIFTISF